MKRETTGKVLFWGAFGAALTLYTLSVPDGLPWNASTRAVAAGAGPAVWRYFVGVFGGHVVALAAVCAALAGAFGAVVVNRLAGWRVGVGAALVWMFLPGVWKAAVSGDTFAGLAALAALGLWVASLAFVGLAARVTASREARGASDRQRELPSADVLERRARRNRLAGWVTLGAAALFAVASLLAHDFRYGEAASAFARGVADEAGERIVIANGVCDEQIAAAARRVVTLGEDEANRARVIAFARAEFPAATNLWAAARISPSAFVREAEKLHGARFYAMTGAGTTPAGWAARWQAFRPHLASSDPFVPMARRLFAYEANALGNRLADAGDLKAAWALYRRIRDEVDPSNASALVNQSELIRRGYAAPEDDKRRVHAALDRFFSDPSCRKHAREIVRAAGPVWSDPKMMERLETEAKARIAAKIAAGEALEIPDGLKTLVEWNNDMVAAMDAGDFVKGANLARAILAKPAWRNFIPANAVMGAVSAHEGDYDASVEFFRLATATTNRVAPVVLNDYADSLMHLGRLDEAEAMARRAVREAPAKDWLARLTLAEILYAERLPEGDTRIAERQALVKGLLKDTPEKVRSRARELRRGDGR